MATSISSYIPTGNASGTRAREQLVFPFTGVPQALTAYVKFRVAVIDASVARVILQIGSATTANPRILLIQPTGTFSYSVQNVNAAGTSVTSAVNTPSVGIGSIVELRAIVNAAGGVTMAVTINGGVETVGVPSAAQALPQVFSAPTLFLNSAQTGAVNFAGYLAVAITRGNLSLPQMRHVAGTFTRNG